MFRRRGFAILAFIMCFSNSFAAGSGASDDGPLLTSFSLTSLPCVIQKMTDRAQGDEYEIGATFPYEIELENLIAEFKTRNDALVYVADVLQKSGVTANDFSVPVTYVVKGSDGKVEHYLVRIAFQPEFKVELGANVHPAYNTTYGMVNIGFDGDLFIGGKFDNVDFGAEATDSYFIFNGQSNGNNIAGFWNILRGAAVGRLRTSKYFAMQIGLGGSWIYSTFEYNGINRYVRNNPGLFAECDIYLSPWKYVRIDILNQFDLFLNTENGDPFVNLENFFPYYKGGIRIDFLNFIKGFRLHLGVAGLYSYYKTNDIQTTIGMLVFEAGLHFDLQFPGLVQPSLTQVQLNHADEDGSTGIGIEALKAAKLNETVEFPDISFKMDSNELTDESLIVLSEIAALMVERKSMGISIKIFSKKGEDPVALLKASLEKAKIVKKILVEKGVESSRVSIPSEVYILDEKYTTKPLLIKIKVLGL